MNDAVSGLDPLGIKLMVVGLTKVGTAIWIYSKLNTSNISRVGKKVKILISIYVKCVQSVHFEMLVFQVSLIFLFKNFLIVLQTTIHTYKPSIACQNGCGRIW